MEVKTEKENLETKIKNIARVVYFSCFLSIVGTAIKILDFAVREDKISPTVTNSSQVWEAVIFRGLSLDQNQPDIKNLLRNAGVEKENRVIFGFLEEKEKGILNEENSKKEPFDISKARGKKSH